MKLARFSIVLLMLAAILGVGACAGPVRIPIPVIVTTQGTPPSGSTEVEPSTDEVVSESGPAVDSASLMDALRTAGATIDPVGEVEQPFFPVSGQVIQVNGEDVQIFEFADAETVQAQAEQLPEDGTSFPTLMITWMAPPHFFQQGQVIVLYVGDDAEILNLLQSVLGPQVAGR